MNQSFKTPSVTHTQKSHMPAPTQIQFTYTHTV